ncbi:hypothetical protein E2562_022967 [Oryza meyeriana var. granulata]|uniref:Uncharacterized protein n=1 Tax=Oryza meyeriana var. granulata TaxID=110450 RepID=A0A6G1D6Y5_9ORYZ|nr:hypothetical protein E2562_022967 [Oryza meyeriana var. granulata]
MKRGPSDDMLGEAKVYTGRESLQADDVRLAIDPGRQGHVLLRKPLGSTASAFTERGMSMKNREVWS